ncbi:unnamed protein product [Schistosoma margrebowiei]|uniref:Uncharacterized protein n=1 Tax=Schistosoma margrebowiei TaxID=48269 RepID=A0A183MAW1_9TREM|nr:unnamed protein product [Schistosoma margrebowiei]
MNDHPSEPLEGDSLDKLNNIDLGHSPDNWSDWFSYMSLKVSVDQLLFFQHSYSYNISGLVFQNNIV